MSIVLGGKRLDVPGVVTVSYLDDPRKVPEQLTDRTRRTGWPRHFTLHTVSGTARGAATTGMLASARDWIYAQYQARTSRYVSWHFTVDTDGSVAWSLDPLLYAAWHAGNQSNAYSIGLELVQGPQGQLYTVQLDAMVRVLDFVAERAGIPRTFPERDGMPYSGMVGRMLNERGAGKDVCGAIGHRNIWQRSGGKLKPMRGFGDPSDAPFHALREAGWRGFDYERNADLAHWQGVQREVGLTGGDVDGVPGPKTQLLLSERGRSLAVAA